MSSPLEHASELLEEGREWGLPNSAYGSPFPLAQSLAPYQLSRPGSSFPAVYPVTQNENIDPVLTFAGHNPEANGFQYATHLPGHDSYREFGDYGSDSGSSNSEFRYYCEEGPRDTPSESGFDLHELEGAGGMRDSESYTEPLELTIVEDGFDLVSFGETRPTPQDKFRGIIDSLLGRRALAPHHAALTNVILPQVASGMIKTLRELETAILMHPLAEDATPDSYLRLADSILELIRETVTAGSLSREDVRAETQQEYTEGYFFEAWFRAVRFVSERLGTSTFDQLKVWQQIRAERQAEYNNDSYVPIWDRMHKTIQSSSFRRGSTQSVSSATLGAASGEASGSENGAAGGTCQDCGKDFRRTCDLTKHKKTHIRPHKCVEDGCRWKTKGFTSEKDLERHINDVHLQASGTQKLYSCHVVNCGYTSTRNSNVKIHMRNVHKIPYQLTRGRSKSREPRPSGVERKRRGST